MFLLNRRTLAQAGSETGAKEEFEILGATGNGRHLVDAACGHLLRIELRTNCLAFARLLVVVPNYWLCVSTSGVVCSLQGDSGQVTHLLLP